MNKKHMTIVLLTTLFSGCGGGGEGANNPTPPSTTVQAAVFEKFSRAGSPYNNEPYDAIGGLGYLYRLQECEGSAFNQETISIYKDGSADISYYNSKLGITFYDKCIVSKTFKILKTEDGSIDASYVGTNLFYDSTTSIFYDVDYIDTYNEQPKITKITNDGQTAIVQKYDGSTTLSRINRSYKEIPASTIGINQPLNPSFDPQKPNTPLEHGLSFGEYKKPYDFKGNYYLYKTQGVSLSSLDPVEYTILNNKTVHISKINRNKNTIETQSGIVTNVYERLNPKNKKQISAQYLGEQTFYDYNEKIYYEVDYYATGNDTLIEIKNDGYNGILQSGKLVRITQSYKEIK